MGPTIGVVFKPHTPEAADFAQALRSAAPDARLLVECEGPHAPGSLPAGFESVDRAEFE